MKRRIEYSARLLVVEDEMSIAIPYEISISATSTNPELQRELQMFLICASKQQESLIKNTPLEEDNSCL